MNASARGVGPAHEGTRARNQRSSDAFQHTVGCALEPHRPGLIAVYADIRGWKGTPALREAARERLSAALERRPDALVVLFGHARLAPMVPSENLVVAWGGEAVMQRAASRWLANASLPPDAA